MGNLFSIRLSQKYTVLRILLKQNPWEGAPNQIFAEYHKKVQKTNKTSPIYNQNSKYELHNWMNAMKPPEIFNNITSLFTSLVSLHEMTWTIILLSNTKYNIK